MVTKVAINGFGRIGRLVFRAIVESGWDLNELRPAAMSLEEIFLQLTGAEAPAATEEVAVKGAK